jgi:hypothetical protein
VSSSRAAAAITGVDGSERQITVSGNELSDPHRIGGV